MSHADRKTAIRQRYLSQSPLAESKIDKRRIMNGTTFTVPPIPTLTGAESTSERATALQAAIWSRPELLTVPGAEPFHLGETAPTISKGYLRDTIFFPLGFGDGFFDSVVATHRAIFHRKSLTGGLRFKDADEPTYPDPPDGAKFASAVISTPFEVIETVV